MKKILLVEDDENFVEIVKYILTTYGFEVHTHTTGLNVPEIVEKYNPNLILLDINLPGKLGTQVCKELKQTSAIPIILFSTHPDQQKVVKECDADGFLEKPFDINELIGSIGLHAN